MIFLKKQFMLLLLLAVVGTALSAQQDSTKVDTTKKDAKKEKEGLPLEPGRKFHLKTNEGTWINLDVSPDGKTLAFDLMGDIYTMPITGGKEIGRAHV